MNFKKFVASLAVSTMLVGSQAAISNADYTGEKSPKTEVSQKANSEGRGVVKTVLNCVPGGFGFYNGLVNFWFRNDPKGPHIKSLKLPSVWLSYGNGYGHFPSMYAFDGLCIAYSVAQFLV